MEKQLVELRHLASNARNRRTETGIPRVAMVQGAIPEHELAAVYDPMINLILTGSKAMTIGERTMRYDPASYFVMSLDLPAVGEVCPDAIGNPYLAVSLTIDPQMVGMMLADLGHVAPPPCSSGFSVASVTPELLDAFAIEGRGIVAEQQDQAIGIVGGAYRLGLATVEFCAFFHLGLRFEWLAGCGRTQVRRPVRNEYSREAQFT